MNNEIKESLTMICEIYRNELENIITQINGTTSGTCYLSGYTLTSVFQRWDLNLPKLQVYYI